MLQMSNGTYKAGWLTCSSYICSDVCHCLMNFMDFMDFMDFMNLTFLL